MYFEYVEQPFRRPPELDGQQLKHSVVIAGAGPVGLCVALALARQNIRSVVLEKRSTISYGSRAICISQRSLDILEKLGVVDPFIAEGYAWASGSTYFKDKLVLEFTMPQAKEAANPAMINLQQCYIEQHLYEAVLKTGLVDVRWNSSIADVRQQANSIFLQIETPEGDYTITSDFLVACDGARSFVRNHLGLCLEGNTYEGRYIIADIHMQTAKQGRRVWFDPPSNPGSTLVMHCQPKDIIRIDYQLLDGEDAEAEADSERVSKRVQAHLDWIGERQPWTLEWVSIYKAHSRTLDDYVHNRVIFAGDAAHLVPIFGVRGLNGGFEDAINLSSRLGPVVKGDAPVATLQGYSQERVAAARENMKQAEKSAAFMTPPSPAHCLMRDAVLSLATSQPYVRELINPRQSQPVKYVANDSVGSDGIVGLACPNLRVLNCENGKVISSSLHKLLGTGVALLLFDAQVDVQTRLRERFPRIRVIRAVADEKHASTGDVIDAAADLRRAIKIPIGGAVLVRADGYVGAHWMINSFDDLSGKLDTYLSINPA